MLINSFASSPCENKYTQNAAHGQEPIINNVTYTVLVATNLDLYQQIIILIYINKLLRFDADQNSYEPYLV